MNLICVSSVLCSILVLGAAHFGSKHNPKGPVYDGIESIIDDAVIHTQAYATELTNRMNQTFHKIQEKVDQWKDNNAFTKQLEAFQADGTTCIKEHEHALAQFMRNLMNTYKSCSQDVKNNLTERMANLQDSLKIIQYAPTKLNMLSDECFVQKSDGLAAGSLCVVSNIVKVETMASEANRLIDEFITNAVREVEAAAVNNCKGIKDLDKEFVQLYNKIKTCIQTKQD